LAENNAEEYNRASLQDGTDFRKCESKFLSFFDNILEETVTGTLQLKKLTEKQQQAKAKDRTTMDMFSSKRKASSSTDTAPPAKRSAQMDDNEIPSNPVHK
jgi:hypothetical protein